MTDYLATVPAVSHESVVWTYQDVVEHILDVFDIARAVDSRPFRLALRAVETAYREIANVNDWLYYQREATFKTEAAQSTGTIQYDHTGNANGERALILTGATWPANILHYRIAIGDGNYQVEEQVSSTVIRLDKDNNPGADVAAGSTYTAYRASYPVPIDFLRMGRLFDVQNELEVTMVPPGNRHASSVYFYDSPDIPWTATIHSTGEFYGAMEFVFSPPPSAAREYSFMYLAGGQPLRTERLSTGTVTTDGTSTVTFSSGVLSDPKHLGAVLRISSNAADEPTSKFGNIDGTANPFAYQAIITKVNSATSATVDRTIPTLTNVKYVVSDPVDIAQDAMMTALQRMAEAEYAHLAGLKDRAERILLAERAILQAMESDRRVSYARTGVPYYDKFSRAIVTTDAG